MVTGEIDLKIKVENVEPVSEILAETQKLLGEMILSKMDIPLPFWSRMSVLRDRIQSLGKET